jgi:hypothetical protein
LIYDIQDAILTKQIALYGRLLLLIKFAEALAVILIAVALVGSGILPIWGDILVILAVIASFVAIFK